MSETIVLEDSGDDAEDVQDASANDESRVEVDESWILADRSGDPVEEKDGEEGGSKESVMKQKVSDSEWFQNIRWLFHSMIYFVRILSKS